MKAVFLVVAFAHAVFCGNVGVRTSSLLSPAGVTYVDGSYHAGLAAGPVSYSAGHSLFQSSAVAAAPVATVSAAPVATVTAQPILRSAAIAAAPAVHAAPVATVTAAPVATVSAQPVFRSAAIAAAPVAYSATRYAAVPTVQHVPGVADVPVTRIEAQPAVIQKTVDVARPAVKTQRYEVRRPAIQKQFYDIEERVVVRPAGSAVVELDEPLSQTQKGPSVIQDSVDSVDSGDSGDSGDSIAVAPPAPPSVVAAAPAVSAAPLPSVDFSLARSSFGGAAQVRGAAYSAPVYASQSVGISAAPVRTVSVSAPIRTVSVSAPVQSASISGISVTPSGPPHISVSTPSPQYPQPIIQTSPRPQIVEDSVSIDSAEFNLARSSGFARQGYQISEQQEYSAPAPPPVVRLSRPEYQTNGLSRQAYQQTGPQVFSAPAPAPVPVSVRVSAPAPAPVPVSVRVSAPASAPVPVSVQASAPAHVQPPTAESVFQSALPQQRISSQPISSPRSSLIVNYPNAIDLVPQHQFRSAAVYSQRSLQSDINQDNQQKLIQLLTARGGVTEIGLGRSGPASYPVEAGEVRARVLSATPAPAYSAPTGERVNTRRVVVSRPIETLQEVEVAEPVTKYERVRVDQPTLIKTARQDLVRVPTSVPVYGKALAPVAEEHYVPLSNDWH